MTQLHILTFDWTELETLEQVKALVRRRLKLTKKAPLTLAYVHHGTVIELADENDFAALQRKIALTPYWVPEDVVINIKPPPTYKYEPVFPAPAPWVPPQAIPVPVSTSVPPDAADQPVGDASQFQGQAVDKSVDEAAMSVPTKRRRRTKAEMEAARAEAAEKQGSAAPDSATPRRKRRTKAEMEAARVEAAAKQAAKAGGGGERAAKKAKPTLDEGADASTDATTDATTDAAAAADATA